MISTNTRSGKRTPVTTMKNGSTVVTHTETYGINVTGTSDFSLVGSWALQPAISSYSKGSPLGSWLPQIAANFDNYDIQALRFNYRAACSTLQPGLVMFSFEPNPEGSPPGSYQELRNMMSTDGSAHANLSFEVGSKLKKGLLTRKGAVVNLPSYDAGKVYFATVGCDDNAKLGFIDVTYTVRLYNPQSSLSTTVPNVVYDQPRPLYRAAFYPTGDASYTVSTAGFGPFDNLHGGPKTGVISMFTPSQMSTGAVNTTYAGGCKFVHPSGATNWFLTKYSGRYRLKYCLNADFKDLYLFAAVPFRVPKGTTQPEPAMMRILDDMIGQTTEDLIVLPVSHRGFTGTATLDPNPGTDLPLVGDWDVILEEGDRLNVMVGIRTYNSVSDSSATVIYRAGLGPTFLDVEFLGPV